MRRQHNVIFAARPRAHIQWRRDLTGLSALALCVQLTLPCTGAVDVLRDVLADHHVPMPETVLKASMEEAFIHAIDPGAQIVQATETAAGARTNVAALAEIEYLPGDILYLPINALNGQAAERIRTVISGWTNAPGEGIILDLRNAGGTDLADVDAVAGVLLRAGETLYTVVNGQGETQKTHVALSASTNASVLPPCILLIGTHTVDAAEILAACLVERRGIMLIGTPTLGRAALRDALPLPDGRVLRIATRWVIPFERPAFQGTGVIPHLEVKDTDRHGQARLPPVSANTRRRSLSEKAKRQRQLRKRVAGDAGLSRAADLLLSLKALRHRDTADARTTVPAPTR